MTRTTPPLFGSDWNADQITRFEEIKDDLSVVSTFQYESAEATLAFVTFKILNRMIPDEQPHFRLPLSRIQETAVEIVCRKLLGDRARSGPPLLHQRENAFPTEHMEPDRELLMGVVKSWFDNDLKHKDDINPGQLRRLEDALKIAQDDLHSIKRTKRSRASKNKRVARVAPNRASDPKA